MLGSIIVGLQAFFSFIYVPGTSLAYPVLFELKNVFVVVGTVMVLGTLSTAWATRGLAKKARSYAVS